VSATRGGTSSLQSATPISTLRFEARAMRDIGAFRESDLLARIGAPPLMLSARVLLMRTLRLLVVSVVAVSTAVLAMGCDGTSEHGNEPQISVSATATIDESGRVVTRESPPEELSRVSTSWARIASVDQEFPRVEAPTGLLAVKGSSISPAGELSLSDGRTVSFDGVACTARGYEYLSRFFLNADATLLVVENGPVVDGKVPADVWLVERFGSITSTSFPVETAITSGWCDAKLSDTSPLNDRFAALATAFAEERKAYKASSP
jgi:hypothetical protein